MNVLKVLINVTLQGFVTTLQVLMIVRVLKVLLEMDLHVKTVMNAHPLLKTIVTRMLSA